MISSGGKDDAGTRPLSRNDVMAGGGTGGLLVYIVNTWVPDDMRTLCLYLVPGVAVVAAAAYGWVTKLIGDEVTYWMAKRSLKKAKNDLAAIEADGSASEQHKKRARETVEAAHESVIGLRLRGL